MATHIALLVLAGLHLATPTSAIFFFGWPSLTAQCDTYTLEWWDGAHPPFTAFVVPINGAPFVYHIPDDTYNGTYGTYDIELQLNAGSNYVVFMSDASGFGKGGSSQIQFVQQTTNTQCLETGSSNATASQFWFQVSGVAKQCERGFELAWYESKSHAPYNFTVIPLDQRFFPYDVPIEPGVRSLSDWTLNMTVNSYFTVMMNNANGYGTGGVGGIYQVANGSSDDCVAQSTQATGSWPVGLATNTLPPGTLAITSPGDKKGLSGGAVAGTVIGVLAAVAIILLAIFFFLRRRRRQRRPREQIKAHEVDLADDTDGVVDGPDPTVEPYHPLTPLTSSPSLEHGGRISMVSNGDTLNSSAGFAGLGAGTAMRNSIDDDDGRPRSGIAGPLPRKSSGLILGESLAASGSSSTMRVVNTDNQPTRLAAALPPGATYGDNYDSRRRREAAGTTYRRHEDAGRLPHTHDDVVDLPPLYTDVPHDEGDQRSPNGLVPETCSPGGSSPRTPDGNSPGAYLPVDQSPGYSPAENQRPLK